MFLWDGCIYSITAHTTPENDLADGMSIASSALIGENGPPTRGIIPFETAPVSPSWFPGHERSSTSEVLLVGRSTYDRLWNITRAHLVTMYISTFKSLFYFFQKSVIGSTLRSRSNWSRFFSYLHLKQHWMKYMIGIRGQYSVITFV